MTSQTQQNMAYDKDPRISLGSSHTAWQGADVWSHISQVVADQDAPLILIDCYPGVDESEIATGIQSAIDGVEIIDVAARCAKPIGEIDSLIDRHLTDDRVFGVMSYFRLHEFYDVEKLTALSGELVNRVKPTVVLGWGAALVDHDPDLLILADMPRWELQQRLRAGLPNWRCDNGDIDTLVKYKRGFFVEWRTADRHKTEMFDSIDFFLDTTVAGDPRLITGETFRHGLESAVAQPFRVVPFFDPGVWGGEWMRTTFNLDDEAPNYAWCFDCVPEENSLAFDVDGVRVEMPAINAVLRHPVNLLGPLNFARFGAEFPIRFDLLDTIEGGNLSLQVHPLREYIEEHFGMPYTQDESYYMLDAEPGAVVYLGLKEGVNPDEFERDLRESETGAIDFPADKHINAVPAQKHDHFSIPAGTIHCSGEGSIVLEISATPFIFTFKLWDWGRVGLDGRPRPINTDRGLENIQWDRDEQWVKRNLLDQVKPLDSGEGWRREQTGMHELEYIETQRTWFTSPTSRHTRGTVNVLNLVEGKAATISSPTGAFEPFELHYAETVIVPASVGEYVVTPVEGSGECATLTAYVRGTQTDLEKAGADLRF